jgi:hypothetical protein
MINVEAQFKSTPESTPKHIYHGQPYARVDPNPMLESTLYQLQQSGTLDLVSVCRAGVKAALKKLPVFQLDSYFKLYLKIASLSIPIVSLDEENRKNTSISLIFSKSFFGLSFQIKAV